MDKSKFEEILITVVVTFFLREIVTFLSKRSIAVATAIKPLAKNIFKRHWRLLPMIFNLLILTASIIFFCNAFTDKTPATRQFVIQSLIMSYVAYNSLNDFVKNLLYYFWPIKDK